MVEDEPSNPIKSGDETSAPAPTNGAPATKDHRYDVGPGFEIAVRGESKHPVELSLSKEADSEHRHAAADRRLEALERSVADLARRLEQVEGESRALRKTA